MARVELQEVKKVYAGGVTAIRDVSLVVPDGSFTVLVGPSGCGKSTLLRMIAGLETITAGTCRIGDHVVNDIEPAERDIAMVFQNYALYPHMSVYDNMAYGLRNRGTPKDEIARRVSEAAKLLAIDEYLDRKPRALSGGQRQRVAMGRAIVREPQVFLFDEPLSNLDAKLRVTMRVEIRRLHNRLQATTVFVTHDQVEAMTLADQVVVMNGGRIEQVGHPGEVYRRPKSSFVATFFGSPGMNMLPGKVTEPGVVDVGGGRFTYDPKYFAGVTGSEVLLGVRPEDLVIAAGQEGVVFRREIVEELGASRVVHGTAGGKPLALAMPVTVAPPSPDEVRVTAPKSAIHLFDPQHGQSLRSVP